MCLPVGKCAYVYFEQVRTYIHTYIYYTYAHIQVLCGIACTFCCATVENCDFGYVNENWLSLVLCIELCDKYCR